MKINDSFSDPIVLDYALPQGSKIGPLGYSQYTKPLGALLQSNQMLYHMYADDTTLETGFNPHSTGDSNLRC